MISRFVILGCLLGSVTSCQDSERKPIRDQDVSTHQAALSEMDIPAPDLPLEPIVDLYAATGIIRHDGDCVLISPPVPVYPTEFTELAEADCEAIITVRPDGYVDVKEVTCTDPRFERATRKGFEVMRFEVPASSGFSCNPRSGEYVYPVSFRME